MNKKRLIVFDMDGVLVDVSESYRTTVRESATCFLKGAIGSKSLPKPLFTLDDLSFVKMSGGLNNDWELTYLIISLLLSVLYRDVENDIGNYNLYKNLPLNILLRKITEKWDLQPLINLLNRYPKPLSFLLKSTGRKIDPLIKILSQGDVGSGNLIKQIFQEVYLGYKLFYNEYRFKPLFFKRKGLLEKEKLIIDIDTLNELNETSILAIATGRPKPEAEYALKRFGIDRYFAYIFTLDECIAEEKRIYKETGRTQKLGKPNPFMLDEIARYAGKDIDKYFYIGDMPDDMKAASNSHYNYTGILFLERKTPSGQKLTKKDNFFLISNFCELKKII